MNSLRVGGVFMWSSYGTGVGATIGISEGRCCGHYLGSHALVIRVVGGLVGASHGVFPVAYIIPFISSSACIFFSPPIHRSSHLHEYGGRQGLFGTTWFQH
jgi:hypothetical protein